VAANASGDFFRVTLSEISQNHIKLHRSYRGKIVVDTIELPLWVNAFLSQRPPKRRRFPPTKRSLLRQGNNTRRPANHRNHLAPTWPTQDASGLAKIHPIEAEISPFLLGSLHIDMIPEGAIGDNRNTRR
jgi:hypothetical protein